MHFYSSSPLSYIPRGSYRPALAPTYLDDEPSSALSFEGGGYPAFPHTFSPRLDAETRYRRALHELQAAEEEYDAHLTLKRARRAAVLREQALRRERALAIEAEVERIERARALQAKLAEEYELHQHAHAHQDQASRDRARRHSLGLFSAFADANQRDASPSECPCAFVRKRPTHCTSERTRRSVLRDNEVATPDDLLRLFPGAHLRPYGPLQQSGSHATSQPRSAEPQPSEKQGAGVGALLRDNNVATATLDDLLKQFSPTHPRPHGPLQQCDSPATLQPHSAEPQTSEKQDAGADALNAILEFIHGLAAHTREAANESEAISKPTPVPQSQAAPADEKGKGKAKAERSEAAGRPTFLHSLFGRLAQGPSDQELKDIELAIKLSLEDRNASEVKNASGVKAVRSNSGASSSRVKLDGAVPLSNTPSGTNDTISVTAKPIPSPAFSPLTTIRAVRNQLSTLESTFKLPAVLDFDQSVLAVSPNNAPLRAYENTLNGFLEQLDAIESDGDEEVRNARRDVVREVEKALADLELKISSQTPKLQVSRDDLEVKGYDAETEEPEASAAQNVPVEATSAAEGVETTVPGPSDAISPVDVGVDLAISGEYLPLPVEFSEPDVAEPGNNAVEQTAEDASSLDADEIPPVLEDPSGSVATITAVPASEPSEVYVPTAPGRETFLATMSHDQFTFPPKPSYSDSGASPAGLHDAVLVDNSEEGESVKSGEDGWSEVDA